MNVQLFEAEIHLHSDRRRDIVDVTFPASLDIPFAVRQSRIVTFSADAARQRLVVGNHYHPGDSGRWELFVVVGTPALPLIEARTRERGGDIVKYTLEAGTAMLIPPTITHGFVALADDVKLWGLSNLPYDRAHGVVDDLFASD